MMFLLRQSHTIVRLSQGPQTSVNKTLSISLVGVQLWTTNTLEMHLEQDKDRRRIQRNRASCCPLQKARDHTVPI